MSVCCLRVTVPCFCDQDRHQVLDVLQYGLGTTQSMDCPRNMVGRVIGKQGETIKQLQRNTGANIQIDQKTDPCTITITGPKNSCSNAMREITAITSDPAMGGVLASYCSPCQLPVCAFDRSRQQPTSPTSQCFLHKKVLVSCHRWLYWTFITLAVAPCNCNLNFWFELATMRDMLMTFLLEE